ncbi:MAG: DUF5666 domain-containing protein [Thiotrichales bacterium]
MNRLIFFFAALLTVLLVSCSSGDDLGSESGIGGTGIEARSITTSGAITGFGSIFVNGIEFETDSADISIDDNPGGENDLKLGMVVTVSGTLDDSGIRAVANRVIFDDDVQGPVTSITTSNDGESKTLTILGLEVIVNRTGTVFDDTSFDSLTENDVLEVSGFRGNDHSLTATRVEKKSVFVSGESEIELRGRISNLGGTVFTLGIFQVDFSNADLSRLPGGVVANGLQVEVKGTLNDDLITATRVKEEDDIFASSSSSSANVSIEGLITEFAGTASFKVSGQLVDASNAVLTPTTLTLTNGARVEVEGSVVDGVLQASKVDARGGSIRIEASVSSVDPDSNMITLQFVPGSVAVQVDAQTLLRDDLKMSDPLTLTTISAGDFIEVRGYLNGANTIVATEIHRDKQDDDMLRGPASACQPGAGLTVLGLRFEFTQATQFRDLNENLISSSDLCQIALTGNLSVKIKDDEEQRDGIADEIELED